MGPFRHSRPSAPAEQASSHMADNVESMRTMDDTGPELYDSFRIGEEDTVLNEIERGSPLPARPPPEQDSEADEFDVADNRVLSRFKWALLVVTAILGAAAATSPFIYSRSQESDAFKQSFDNDATHFVEAFYLQQTNTLWALSSLASNYKSLAAYSTTNFPNVTMSDIHNQGLPSLHFSESDSIFFAPMLTSSSDQKSWEQYAVQNQRLAGISYKGSFRPIEQGVFRLNGTNQIMDDQYDDFPKLPIWQIMPSKFRRHANLFNIMSLSSIPNAIWLNGFDRGPFFSPFLEQHEANFLSGTMASDPRSVVLLPILQNDEIVGAVGEEVNWTKCFDNVIHDGAEVQIVLYNSCGQVHTYQVKEGKAFHIGEGELLKYGDQYLDMSRGVSLSEMKSFLLQEQVWYQSNEDLPSQNFSEHQLLEGQDSCMYYIVVHPTTEYEAAFRTVFPVASCLVSMGGAILLLALFGTFTVLVQRRERQVLNSAAKSHAIIKSLFPAVVRDRLFGLRSMHRNNKPQASFSRRRSIQLMPIKDSLTDLGPGSARNRLSNFLTASTDLGDFTEGDEAEPIAEMFSATTILFADIAGFTAWSSEREPSQVFTLLETLYHEFDMIAKRLNVFKVETIGDCYVAVSGLPEPNDDHAKVMSRFAYEILLATSHLTQHLESTLGPGTSELGLRIGLHSGSVTAGVLRGAKSRFQLFGDTMNTASRMESTGIEGKIQVSEATADLISRAGKSHWLTPREELVSVKGKGEMQVCITLFGLDMGLTLAPLIDLLNADLLVDDSSSFQPVTNYSR
jgi:class 3 adenylate cyclase